METEMGYRGSKSVSLFLKNFEDTVKEQRVDGSLLLKNNIRCTLMGWETSYQVKALTKQLNRLSHNNITKLNIRSFSTKASSTKLNPGFISGFSDAESCFSISITPNPKLNTK
jgi:hypothetical protein